MSERVYDFLDEELKYTTYLAILINTMVHAGADLPESGRVYEDSAIQFATKRLELLATLEAEKRSGELVNAFTNVLAEFFEATTLELKNLPSDVVARLDPFAAKVVQASVRVLLG